MCCFSCLRAAWGWTGSTAASVRLRNSAVRLRHSAAGASDRRTIRVRVHSVREGSSALADAAGSEPNALPKVLVARAARFTGTAPELIRLASDILDARNRRIKFDLEDDFADAELVSLPQRIIHMILLHRLLEGFPFLALADLLPVDEGAVEAAEILDTNVRRGHRDAAMVPRHAVQGIFQRQRTISCPADGVIRLVLQNKLLAL